MSRPPQGKDLEGPINEVLIETSIKGWKEYELEVMRDRADNCVIICSIENIDAMGVHTGDSITVAPAMTLSDVEYQEMRNAALRDLAVAQERADQAGEWRRLWEESESGREAAEAMGNRE